MGATTFADALSLHESGHTAAAITAYRAVVVVRDHPHAAAAYSTAVGAASPDAFAKLLRRMLIV